MLQVFYHVHHTEHFTLSCKGAHARTLVDALAKLFAALGVHVEREGLELTCRVLDINAQMSREGHTSAALVAIIEDTKRRANALFEAGYVAGAMRKYVRATFLAQDGDEKEDPGAPMIEVVGTGSGTCRFDAGDAAKVTALRVSLHLNLAAGAIKCKEFYGALAAAEVALRLQPDGVKPLFRKAQAHLALQEFAEAEAAVGTLLKREPNNSAARRLLADSKGQRAEQARRTRATFSGMFDRAQRQPEGALFSEDEISRAARLEKERTKFVRDRAEEKRRGVEAIDVAEVSRLPDEYKQRELDKMNECIENESDQSKIPDGISEKQFRKLLQMRTDGVNEERIQEEMGKMRRAEQEESKKWMLPKERERMRERNEALIRDRYKSDEVVAEREREMWEEYKEIKERVDRRKVLLQADQKRQEQRMLECNEILQNPEAEEEEKHTAIKRMLHEPFQDLDEFLTPDEFEELDELKAKGGEDPRVAEKLQKMLLEVTSRKIEAKIDELLDRENDVLI